MAPSKAQSKPIKNTLLTKYFQSKPAQQPQRTSSTSSVGPEPATQPVAVAKSLLSSGAAAPAVKSASCNAKVLSREESLVRSDPSSSAVVQGSSSTSAHLERSGKTRSQASSEAKEPGHLQPQTTSQKTREFFGVVISLPVTDNFLRRASPHHEPSLDHLIHLIHRLSVADGSPSE